MKKTAQHYQICVQIHQQSQGRMPCEDLSIKSLVKEYSEGNLWKGTKVYNRPER